jgi:SAM-dependent methyltransferase
VLNPEDGERERLRATFDTAADLYQRARPTYPPALLDDLIDIAQLVPGDHLFEVGCATGQATLPLAQRGFRITAIELGAELAAAARENLAEYSNVTVIDGDFETWIPPVGLHCDMMFAATAWHWIDPAVRYVKAFDMVRPGGHLAVWSATHVVPDGGDALFHEIQDVYDEIGEGLPPQVGFPRPGELDEPDLERESDGLFETVAIRHIDWETVYDAEGYIDLLNTFSGHIAMQPWQRDRLYGEIRRRVNSRADPRLRRHWGAVLAIARRS